MRVRNLKHAKELGLKKWDYLRKHSYEDIDDCGDDLINNFPELCELAGYCGFCEYYVQRRGEGGTYPCVLARNHTCCRGSRDDGCCDGLFRTHELEPSKENAQKVYDYIKNKKVRGEK